MNMLLRTCLLLLCHIALAELALPSGWKTCEENDPERNKCLQDAINIAIQSMENGNKKLGVLPIDPFHFGEVQTKSSSNGPVSLELIFKDFVLYYFRNLVITSAKLEGRTLKLAGSTPGKLEAISPYVIKGKILALPLNGEGMGNFTFWHGNQTYDLTFRKEPEVKNGKKYLVVEKLVFRAYPEKVGFQLENLINKQIGATMNNVLNENWEVVWNELKNLFQDAIGDAFRQVCNRVFSHIPMDEINLF